MTLDPTMANKIMLPSLSEDGWVNSSIRICDLLLSHFFLSDYSQSYVYHGNVSSLPWILLDTQGDISKTVIKTRETLSTYFSRYFNNVEVEVSEVPNTEDPSKGQISIYVRFKDTDGNDYVLGKLLRIANTTIENIITINNG